MRLLQIDNQQELIGLLKDIKVDPYGIKIMLPKAVNYLIRLKDLPNISANILKQEMLSLGADAAVARDALTGKAKVTDCLLIGNLAQFRRLNEKLNKQPFGLSGLSVALKSAINNYQRDKFVLDLGRCKLRLGRDASVMGIINLTPDSFSGDGLYQVTKSQCHKVTSIVEIAQQMVEDGADIIDLGGESTRPGAKAVPLKEEIQRVIPTLKLLVKKIKKPISIDTTKPEVAQQALDNGAVIINDISGLRNPKMAKVIARYKAAVIIMHMKGNPRTMQDGPVYKSLIDEIVTHLDRAIGSACGAGIDKEKIIIDPGLGFGKTLEHNLEILNNLKEFKVLGRPIMVGPSRKSFIGKLLNAGPEDRVTGSISSCILAVKNGASIVRVHDVKPVKDALKVAQAIINNGEIRR